MYPIKPVAVNGKTTAINAPISNTSVAHQIVPGNGNIVYISVGSNAGLYVQFGKVQDSVSSSTGWRMPPDSCLPFSIPAYASAILFIRDGSVDTSVSLLFSDGGI